MHIGDTVIGTSNSPYSRTSSGTEWIVVYIFENNPTSDNVFDKNIVVARPDDNRAIEHYKNIVCKQIRISENRSDTFNNNCYCVNSTYFEVTRPFASDNQSCTAYLQSME